MSFVLNNDHSQSLNLADVSKANKSNDVLERRENEYWKIKVDDFQSWMLGFYQFVGEWKTIEIAPKTIQIDYSYTMYAHGFLYYPLDWLFTKLFWRRYMKQVLKNIEQLIENGEPFKYL